MLNETPKTDTDNGDVPARIAALESAVKELAAALEKQIAANAAGDADFLDHIFSTYFRGDYETHKARKAAEAKAKA